MSLDDKTGGVAQEVQALPEDKNIKGFSKLKVDRSHLPAAPRKLCCRRIDRQGFEGCRLGYTQSGNGWSYDRILAKSHRRKIVVSTGSLHRALSHASEAQAIFSTSHPT